MKLTRKFYRRYGDKASCRDWVARTTLFDNSSFGISLTLVLFPKRPFVSQKFEWYLSISNSGPHLNNIANHWKNNHSTRNWKKNIKKIIELAEFNCNKLTNHGYKERQKIIKSWFDSILEKTS